MQNVSKKAIQITYTFFRLTFIYEKLLEISETNKPNEEKLYSDLTASEYDFSLDKKNAHLNMDNMIVGYASVSTSEQNLENGIPSASSSPFNMRNLRIIEISPPLITFRHLIGSYQYFAH